MRDYDSGIQLGVRSLPVAGGMKFLLVFYGCECYNKNVIQRIMDKCDMNQMEASRAFLTSEAHAMLEGAELAMWEFSDRAVFDMWEWNESLAIPAIQFI